MATKLSAERINELETIARKRLTEMLPKGSTVYTFFVKTTGTGVKHYGVFAIEDGKIVSIANYAARLTGRKWNDKTNTLTLQNSAQDIVEGLIFALFGEHKLPSDETLKHSDL